MKQIIYLVLFLVFIFSSLNLTENLNVVAINIVYILLSLLLIIPFFLFKKEMVVNKPIFIVMILYTLLCVLASFVNSDIRLMISSLLLLILFLVSCVILPMLKLEINALIFNALLTSHLLIILIPIIMEGINDIPYRGIFYNTNSFGQISATIFIVLWARVLIYLENLIKGQNTTKSKMNYFNFIFQGILLISSFYLIVISGSRTSFLAATIVVLIGCLTIFVYIIKYKKVGILIMRGGILSLIMLFVLSIINRFTNLGKVIMNNIIYKFTLRANQSSGILSARDRIWAETIENSKIFGHGNNYFGEMGIGAHNTLISILGQYGLISLIIFVIFLTMVFYFNLKYSLSNTNNKYKYLPLMIFIGFLAMSMGEDMTFKLSMLIMFFSFGEVIMKNNEIVHT